MADEQFIIRKIKFRPDYEADWTDLNPILPAGEIGISYPNKELKFGDGITLWNDLPPFNGHISDLPDNILASDVDGHLYVPTEINDALSSLVKTYSSQKIDQLTSKKLNVLSINSATPLLDIAKAGTTTYLRYTRALGTALEINATQLYESGMIFNIRASGGIITLNPVNITLNTPPNGSLIIPNGGNISIVFVSPAEADVFGYIEFT